MYQNPFSVCRYGKYNGNHLAIFIMICINFPSFTSFLVFDICRSSLYFTKAKANCVICIVEGVLRISNT